MFTKEEDVQKNVKDNMNFIMWKFGIDTQRKLAEMVDIAPAQLTRIMHGDQTPTVYPFLINIKEKFGYTIDEFLFTNLRNTYEELNGTAEDISSASYMKFTGLYQMYYFDTSSYKGRERAEDVKALKSGLLLIQKTPKAEKEYRVIAVFDMKKNYADECYETAMKCSAGGSLDNMWNYISTLAGSNHVYYGDFELSANHVYIALHFENTKDRVQMIFHRPSSKAPKYIGGLGAMISVSKGRNPDPCVQYIALAETSLHVSEEEIASRLLMHYPNLKTYDSIDSLIDMLVQLYQNEKGEQSRLTEAQKKMLVRHHVDKIVNDTVEKNLFRTVVVSSVDDDEFYHYIKRVKAYMRQEARS